MKNTINTIITTLVFSLLCSCSMSLNQEQTDAPYYQFNNQDSALIINYNYVPDQIITYQNDEGQTIRFKVLSNQTSKNASYSDGSLSGGEGLLENYYDSKIIRFEILENTSEQPHAAVNYIFSKNSNTLNNGFNFPMWNVPVFSYIDEPQNTANIFLEPYNTLPKTSLTIDGHQFNKVVTINSNSDQSNTNNLFGPLTQNINQIRYDYDFGIIEFKDIQGRLWRLVYPD